MAAVWNGVRGSEVFLPLPNKFINLLFSSPYKDSTVRAPDMFYSIESSRDRLASYERALSYFLNVA